MSGPTVDIVTDISVPADATVLALGVVIRGGKKPVEAFHQGIAMCDQVLSLIAPCQWEGTTKNETERRQLLDQLLQAFSTEDEVLQFFTKTKEVLVGLTEPEEDIPIDELCQIQQTLVACSMSSWRARHLEFRQRRLKRRLKRYG